MRPSRVAAFILFAAFPAFAVPAQAQDTGPCFARGTPDALASRPSPLGMTAISFGQEEATLCYGRPSARERTVMGELVPFGSPWRLGANEATAIHLPFAAEIGGVAVEPGSYSLFVTPGAEEWEFVVNRNHERWGVPINDEVRAGDVGSFTRPVAATSAFVEQLTISWESHGDTMGHLVVEWENTRVEVPMQKGGA